MATVWVGLGGAFENPSMETILSFGVPRTLNTIWDTMSQIETGVAATYQELYVKDRKGYKESASTGGLIPLKDPLYLIEVPSMFTRSRQKMRDLGVTELGQAYDQPEQVMSRMKNYATRPSVIPFLTYIPETIPWVVLRVSVSIHGFHPSSKTVPEDQQIGSLGTSLDTFKG